MRNTRNRVVVTIVLSLIVSMLCILFSGCDTKGEKPEYIITIMIHTSNDGGREFRRIDMYAVLDWDSDELEEPPFVSGAASFFIDGHKTPLHYVGMSMHDSYAWEFDYHFPVGKTYNLTFVWGGAYFSNDIYVGESITLIDVIENADSTLTISWNAPSVPADATRCLIGGYAPHSSEYSRYTIRDIQNNGSLTIPLEIINRFDRITDIEFVQANYNMYERNSIAIEHLRRDSFVLEEYMFKIKMLR